MLRIGLVGSLAVSTIGTALLVQANVPFAVAVLILSGFSTLLTRRPMPLYARCWNQGSHLHGLEEPARLLCLLDIGYFKWPHRLIRKPSSRRIGAHDSPGLTC
jgi:hypothetical protein